MLTLGLNTFSCWTAFVATAGSSSMSTSSLLTLLGVLPKVSDPQASSKSSSTSKGQELRRAKSRLSPNRTAKDAFKDKRALPAAPKHSIQQYIVDLRYCTGDLARDQATK